MMFWSPGRGAADRDAGRAAHQHAERPVPERVVAGVVGADAVAQDQDAPAWPRPAIDTPACALAEITLPAPWAVPPMVVPGAASIDTPSPRVGQRLGSGLVDADVIALDQRVRHAAADVDAVAVVPRDHVAGQGGRPADRGARAAGELDAGGEVAHRDGPLDVGADQVARDQGPRRGRAGDQDSFRVPRDEVARPAHGPADRVGRGTGVDQHAGPAVAQGECAGLVEADQVALDEVGAGVARSPRRCVLPEMRLPAPVDVPPIVLLLALDSIKMPSSALPRN